MRVVFLYIRHFHDNLVFVLADDFCLMLNAESVCRKQHGGDYIHVRTADKELVSHLHFSRNALGYDCRLGILYREIIFRRAFAFGVREYYLSADGAVRHADTYLGVGYSLSDLCLDISDFGGYHVVKALSFNLYFGADATLLR